MSFDLNRIANMAVLQASGFNTAAASTIADSGNLLDILKQMNELEGLDEAGEQVQEAINNDPAIATALEKQLQEDPSLKSRVLDMARNDPEALSEKIPQMLAQPTEAAVILDGQALPSETAPAEVITATNDSDVQGNDPVSEQPASQQEETTLSQSGQEPLAAATATSTAPEEATRGPGSYSENFNWQSGANPSVQTVDNDQMVRADASSQDMQAAENNAQGQRADMASNTADVGAEENAAAATEISSQQAMEGRMASMMQSMLEQPGGKEFFEKIENNPELNAAMGNALGGENADPQRTLAVFNELKVRADNDPEFFNKANNFMDEHPGMVQNFAETFANDPDKAFARLDQALALDNAMGGMETLLSRFLGPELSGQIMGFMGELLEMFMPMMGMFDDLKGAFGGTENDIAGQSNNGGELARDVTAMAGNDAGNLAMHDENGRPERAADGQTLEEQNPNQRAVTTGPAMGS